MDPQCLAVPRCLMYVMERNSIKGVTGWIIAAAVGLMGVTMSERPLMARGSIATAVMTLCSTAGRVGRISACAVSALAPAGPAAESGPVVVVALVVRPMVIVVLTTA